MRVTLISKASNIRSKINAYAGLAAKLRDEAQTLAANTLYHAAQHGDCSLLNQFFGFLSEGDKASFKRWVVAEVSSVYDADVKTSDLFIGMKKEEFFIRKDTIPYRNEFTARVDAILADENQAMAYGKFFDINPDKVKNPFDTAALLKMIDNAVKRADKEESKVEPEVRKALSELSAAFHQKVKPFLPKEATIH